MERSGFAYQTLGEPERSLLEERRGEVMDEDITEDVLMGQGQTDPPPTYTIGHVQPP